MPFHNAARDARQHDLRKAVIVVGHAHRPDVRDRRAFAHRGEFQAHALLLHARQLARRDWLHFHAAHRTVSRTVPDVVHHRTRPADAVAFRAFLVLMPRRLQADGKERAHRERERKNGDVRFFHDYSPAADKKVSVGA